MTTRALALTDLPAVPEPDPTAKHFDWLMHGRTVCCLVRGREGFRFQLGDVVPVSVIDGLASRDVRRSVLDALQDLGYEFQPVARAWHRPQMSRRMADSSYAHSLSSSGYFHTYGSYVLTATTVWYASSQ